MISWRTQSYINGNYCVAASQYSFTRVKRALRSGEDFKAEFPDSIDLKITNICRVGCPFCHESSTPGGGSFDLEKTKALLTTLPRVGIELAIGGGDVLEIPKETLALIKWAKEWGFKPRITVNLKSIEKNLDSLKQEQEYYLAERFDKKPPGTKPLDTSRYEILSEVEALGVSIDKYYDETQSSSIFEFIPIASHSPVFHIIAGEFPPPDLEAMWNRSGTYERILILGYKDFGRATGRPPKYDLGKWSESLKRLIWKSRSSQSTFQPIVAFDNLALDQLGIREALTSEEWGSRYFGDEFSGSMYIDAVSGTFSPTSRSPFSEREPWGNYEDNIVKYFKARHNNG